VKLTTEEMTKTETYLKETDTSKYKDLQELKNKDEQFYQKVMAEVYRDMLFLERLKKENPSLYKNIMEERTLDSACRQIIKKLKEEKDSSRIKAYKDELKNNLSKIFDLRQISREEKIKRIESDIAKLKAKNEQRKKEKSKIVDLRLSEIIGRAEGLEW